MLIFENLEKKCTDKCLKCLPISKCRQKKKKKEKEKKKKKLNLTLKIDNTKIVLKRIVMFSKYHYLQWWLNLPALLAQLTLHQG